MDVSHGFIPQRFPSATRHLDPHLLCFTASTCTSCTLQVLPSYKKQKLTCAEQNDIESEVAVEGFEDLQGDSLGRAERLCRHGLRRVEQQDDFIGR